MNSRITRVLGFVLATVMACAFTEAIRFAYADYLARADSPAQVQAALKIAPDNAAYWLHWSDLAEADGASGLAGIQRAAGLDPYDAAVWIAGGLKAEMSGDYANAERDLLRGARYSRQFEPRWVLANYYFRRGDAARFWPWAKSAMEWAYQDRTPLFDLCWRMQPDSGVILDRAIPDNPKVLRDYLGYLLGTGRVDAAVAAAHRLGAHVSDKDRDVLLWYVGVMLDQRRWQDALSAWNILCQRKLIADSPLDPIRGRVLTNGAFSTEPLGAGFDWRIPQVQGFSAERAVSPPSLRFDFDGKEPETFDVLSQFVPVKAGQRYGFQFGYRTEGITANTGLEWRITDAATGAAMAAGRASLSSDEWTGQGLAFTVPPGVQMARLVLEYRRVPGTVRIEGSLWLRDVGLECQP